MSNASTTWKSAGTIVLRMAIVMGVVVAMPIWSVFEAGVPADLRAQWVRLGALARLQRLVHAAAARGTTTDITESDESVEPRSPSRLEVAVQSDNGRVGRNGFSRKQPLPDARTAAKKSTQQRTRQELMRMADRLRRMGATAMRLEKSRTGSSRGEYYFMCRMPLPSNPVYYKQFEARSTSPTVAIRQVTEAIQRWTGAASTARR